MNTDFHTWAKHFLNLTHIQSFLEIKIVLLTSLPQRTKDFSFFVFNIDWWMNLKVFHSWGSAGICEPIINFKMWKIQNYLHQRSKCQGASAQRPPPLGDTHGFSVSFYILRRIFFQCRLSFFTFFPFKKTLDKNWGRNKVWGCYSNCGPLVLKAWMLPTQPHRFSFWVRP
jgi:hypothetical protein